jgi:hypothetical protein
MSAVQNVAVEIDGAYLAHVNQATHERRVAQGVDSSLSLFPGGILYNATSLFRHPKSTIYPQNTD